MKLTVEKEDGNTRMVKAEYSPEEALVINHAMRRYVCDEKVSEKNREIMEQMLETKPICRKKVSK